MENRAHHSLISIHWYNKSRLDCLCLFSLVYKYMLLRYILFYCCYKNTMSYFSIRHVRVPHSSKANHCHTHSIQHLLTSQAQRVLQIQNTPWQSTLRLPRCHFAQCVHMNKMYTWPRYSNFISPQQFTCLV